SPAGPAILLFRCRGGTDRMAYCKQDKDLRDRTCSSRALRPAIDVDSAEQPGELLFANVLLPRQAPWARRDGPCRGSRTCLPFFAARKAAFDVSDVKTIAGTSHLPERSRTCAYGLIEWVDLGCGACAWRGRKKSGRTEVRPLN